MYVKVHPAACFFIWPVDCGRVGVTPGMREETSADAQVLPWPGSLPQPKWVSRATPGKLEHIPRVAMDLGVKFIQIRCNHAGKTWARRPLLYIDPTSGPGRYLLKDGSVADGSPAIFPTVWRRMGLEVEPWFCEKNRAAFRCLEFVAESLEPANWMCRSLEEFLPWLPQHIDSPRFRQGLLFFDPQKGRIPAETLAGVNRAMPMVDQLLYVSPTMYKRAEKGAPGRGWANHLEESLDVIGKKRVFLRAPEQVTGWDWTLVFLTNWWAMNLSGLEDIGFYALDSPQGRAIWEIFTRGRKELSEDSKWCLKQWKQQQKGVLLA